MSRRAPYVSVLIALALSVAGLLALAGSASALDGWEHGTATDESFCAAGCHAETTPTNATCTRCHTGYAARSTQKCWDCHKPSQSTSSWQLAAGCTTSCHISTATGREPSYSVAFTHLTTVHLGATGYGKTCVDCHGVSTGSTTPGTSPHHDTVDSQAPTCAGCHNGGIAAAPTGHSGYGTLCTACHVGMNRPSGDCATCHVGKTGTTIPQITFTNNMACGDASCHGKVANHSGTPISSAACTTCHAGHHATLGSCGTCHPQPQTFHHGTTLARPLADCAGCHDGGIATAKASHAGMACSVCHAGMGKPAVPAVCAQCHLAKKVGSTACTTCHSKTGMAGREQVHNATPKAGLTCTTCHAGHNEDLGACTTCHGLVPEAHHGVASVAGSTITLLPEPARLAPGAAGAVSGTLTSAGGAGVGGAQVLLQARRLGTRGFTDVVTLVTGADGTFAQPVQPVTGTEYRAVYRGTWSAASATVNRPALVAATMRVAQTVTLGARPASARVGARVKLSGAAAPTAQQLGASGPAVTLRVDRKRGSRWVKAASVKLKPKADGRFSWTWRPRKAGSYRVTASVADRADLLGAKVQVKVRVR